MRKWVKCQQINSWNSKKGWGVLEDRGEELQALINVNPSQGLKHGGAGELHHEKSLSALATLLVKGIFYHFSFQQGDRHLDVPFKHHN